MPLYDHPKPLYSVEQIQRIIELNDEFRRGITIDQIGWSSELVDATIDVVEQVVEIIRNYDEFVDEETVPNQHMLGHFDFLGKKRGWYIGFESRIQPEPDYLPRHDPDKVKRSLVVTDRD